MQYLDIPFKMIRNPIKYLYMRVQRLNAGLRLKESSFVVRLVIACGKSQMRQQMSSEIVTRGVLLTGQKSDKVSHRAISSALTARFFIHA